MVAEEVDVSRLITIRTPDGLTLWQSNPGPQTEVLYRRETEVLYGGARGGGKLSPLDSLVCTPKGFVKMGALKVGDTVSDPTTGGESKVIAVHPHPPMKIWKLTFDDGAALEVGEEHLWSFREASRQRPGTKPSSQREFARTELASTPAESRWNNYRVGNTKEILDGFKRGRKFRFPLTEPVSFTKYWRPRTQLSAYVIGLHLGDGHLNSAIVSNIDAEIIDHLRSLGYTSYKGNKAHGAKGIHRREVRQFFRSNGLLKCRSWEKFVPDSLKYGSVEERLEVLRGLLDTDGTVDKRGRVYFISTSRQLSEDVQWLVRSLGGKARMRTRLTHYPYKGEIKDGRASYQVRIWHRKTSSLFRLSRKKARCMDSWNGGHELSRELVKVEYAGEKEARCITVSSPLGLYLGNDFVVTHNSQAGIVWLLLGNFDLDPSEPHFNTYLNDRNYKALVVRRNAEDLKEWVDEAYKIFGPLGATKTGKPVTFEFPSGAKIYTNHLDSEDAFEKYKGWSLWKILIEELTLIRKANSYLKLLGSLRAFNSNGKARPQLFATTNPDGEGSAWVCNRFIEVASAAGKNVPWGSPMYDPITKMWRIFVPAKVGDNPYAKNDQNYMGMLLSQDKQTQDAWILGLWHSMAGTFFREWRNQLTLGPRVGEPAWANHVIAPTELKPWWFRWGGGDWGFKHYAALYKFCKNQSDGRIHVYDELVMQGIGAFELGTKIARWWAPDLEMLPDRQIALHFSPDAFDVRDARNTIAQQVQAGIMAVLGPGSAFIHKYDDDEKMMAQRDPEAAQRLFNARRSGETGSVCISLKRANHNRPAGASFIRDLLRWRPAETPARPDLDYAKKLYEEKGLVAYTDYLRRYKGQKEEILPKIQVWQRQSSGGPGCPRLIRCIPMLQHDPKRTEDVLKIDAEPGQSGDDEYDGFRYGCLAAKDIEKIIPKEYFVSEQLSEWGKQYSDPNILAQIRMTQEHRYEQQNPGGGSFTFARAGSSQHRKN